MLIVEVEVVFKLLVLQGLIIEVVLVIVFMIVYGDSNEVLEEFKVWYQEEIQEYIECIDLLQLKFQYLF